MLKVSVISRKAFAQVALNQRVITLLGGKVRLAEFAGRDLHLVKKALAISILAIERQPGPFQSISDMADMKRLLADLIESETELEHYAKAAHTAVTGESD